MHLSTIRAGIWLYIASALILFSIFEFWAPTAAEFEYTYQRPIAHPTTLQSQRWSFYFVSTGLSVLFLFAPFSLAYALEDASGEVTADPLTGRVDKIRFWRIEMHIAVVSLVALWFFWGAFFTNVVTCWVHANKRDASNYHNPANDPRWCCVYYNLADHNENPSFPCVNTAGCSPAVDASHLITNPLFSFQLWYSFVLWIVLVVDALLTLLLLWPAYTTISTKMWNKRNSIAK